MSDFWSIVDRSLDTAQEMELECRRDIRLENCMKMVIVSELQNGGRKVSYWRCKDPRCDNCNEWKASKIRERIERVISLGSDVMCSYAFPSVADKLCKKIGRDNYLRLPQDDYDIVFFVSTQADPEIQYVDKKFIDEFDWKEASRKKTSRIMSGNLGKDKDENKSGKYTVEAYDIIAGPFELVNKSIKEACFSCIAWIQPETIEQNRSYRKAFASELTKSMVLNGCNIFFTLKREMKIDDLDVSYFHTEYNDGLDPSYS